MIYYLDVEIVKAECHPATVKYFDKKHDPIAPFNTARLELLDSALNQPAVTFNSNDLYESLVKKASVLLYGLIKNHPFKCGYQKTSPYGRVF